jgi:NADPH2:quinone reductase
MKAIQIARLDGPQALQLVDVPDPPPSSDEVLIDVHAAGVTFPEVLQSRGLYQLKPELPFIPGSEVAGVVRTAPASSGLRAGQRVVAFVGLGGFAEQVSVDASRVFALPDGISMETAAALPMNYFTMHFALQRRGHLQRGETVLVHGAAGGIGTAATELAKAYGARVIGVVSTEAKEQVAKWAGADEVIRTEGFLARVKELTGGAGVNMVVDPVGGTPFTDSLRSLAPEGRLLVIGFTAGEIPQVKVNRLLLNNIAVVGVGWGAFFLQQSEYLQQQWRELLPLLPKLKPIIGATYPLAQAAQAVAEIEERRAKGKVLLKVRA